MIVTGCLGATPDLIRAAAPKVLSITGPQQYETVVNAVHDVIAAQARPVLRSGAAGGPEARRRATTPI